MPRNVKKIAFVPSVKVLLENKSFSYKVKGKVLSFRSQSALSVF